MKYFVIAFSLLFFGLEAQVTNKPDVQKQSSQETRITKITINENETIVDFQFKMKTKQGDFDRRGNSPYGFPSFPGLGGSRSVTNTISFDADSYLYDRISKKKFRFVSARNIPISPKSKQVIEDEVYKFSVVFEKLEKGIEVIDLIEGKDEPNSNLKHWNFFTISINNPKEEKTEMAIVGNIFDESSKKKIKGKLYVYTENYNDLIDSINISESGKYKMVLEPNNYSFIVKSEGFEDEKGDFNLTKIKKGEFNQDFFLKKKEITTKVEVKPKTESTNSIETASVGESVTIQNLLFETSKADLKPESYTELDKLAESMKANSNLTIRLEGHTDNVGDKQLNMQLSLDRVTSVRKYLIAKGIEGKRVALKGYGGTKPLNPNGTDLERQVNRRVEIVILSK